MNSPVPTVRDLPPVRSSPRNLPRNPPRRTPRRSPSLEWRLPLLMSGVLAVILVAALAVTYATLTRAAVTTAGDRLRSAARQLATVAENGVRQGRGRYRDVGRESEIRDALRAAAAPSHAAGPRHLASPAGRGPSSALVRSALARLVTPADSGMPVELWTADGRRIAFVGRDLGTPAEAGPRAAVRPVDTSATRRLPIPRPGLAAIAHPDSFGLGALYAANGRVHYWLVAPVRDRGVVLGYLAHQRRVAGGPETERTIRALSGNAVAAYYRNRDGAFWATLSGAPATPPGREASGRGTRPTRPGLGALLTAEAPIGRTPLVIVFELPRQRVLAAPREALLTLGAISLALLAVGAAASWAISRRITRPIASLTVAAEAIARGDYDARAEVTGDDEVAHLAARFNRMGREIAGVRRVLERQSAEARASADELARSNTELVTAREAAEAASRAKSQFLATMSHELRTPLNAIGGYTELLEMELRGPLTDLQRRDLERIRVSQQHLLGLIGGVLDMSRIERGQVAYHLAPTPLDTFLAELDTLVAPQAAAKRLALEYVPCAPDLAVIADREKLRQILLNLFSNAIRCTPPGGVITLEALVRDGASVEISVRDTGVGIPAEKQAQIFEPFVQLDRSLSQVREGVGLGLAISRDLARGMGGELTVESRVDHGSCFTLTLPRATPARVTPDELAVTRTVAKRAGALVHA